MMVGVAVA